MRFSRLSFVSALLMTVAITFIVMLYNYYKTKVQDVDSNSTVLFLVSIVLIFIITFVGIEILFSKYGRRQLRKMADRLPDDLFDTNENIGFKEFSDKIFVLKKEQESELDTMKELETYRKEYIGNVSHELKTPLFSIQGYVETLKDGAIDNLTVRDKYLDRIGFSVERLIEIVKDLDMINRFEAGEINLEYSDFDLNALIREIFDLLDLNVQKSGATTKLQSSSSVIMVNADKQKVSQVLINLISNAIHYANRQQARIVVHTSILKDKVFVQVEDNGMGIKKEILPRIFERFYRAETSRNRKDGGSGLGLAIVKHILEAHGGHIKVESEYLEGTKFSFLLDLSDSTKA